MRRLVWIAPWLVALCFSCTNRDTVTKAEVEKTPDIVREDAGTTSRFYDSENPYTERCVNAARENVAVQADVSRFEGMGYACRPEECFVAEGVGPDGEAVTITVVAMGSVAGATTDEVYVFYLESGGYEYSVPVRVRRSNSPPGEGFEKMGDGVWMSLAGDPLAGSPPLGTTGTDGRMGAAARFSWNLWLRCVAERLAAGAASCAVTCAFSAMFYLQCFAKCTAGYAVYAMVYCAGLQL